MIFNPFDLTGANRCRMSWRQPPSMRRGQHGWNLASDSIRFQKISEALTVSDPVWYCVLQLLLLLYFFCLFFLLVFFVSWLLHATARVLKRPTCPILLRRTIWTGWQLHWLVFHSFQGWQKAQRLRAFDTLGQDDEDGELWDGNDNEARNCQSVRAQVCSSNQT